MGNTDCSCIRQYMQKEPTMIMEPTPKAIVQADNEEAHGEVSAQVEVDLQVSSQPEDPSEHQTSAWQLARTISLSGQLGLQTVSRGFLVRKKGLPTFRAAKALATDETRQMEALKPENRFKVITNNLKDRLKGPVVLQVEAKHGKFSIKEPLEDGVDVEQKPAFILDNGALYKGEWNRWGQKHGRGKEVYSDGTWYSGYFQHDRMSGIGRLVYPNGDMYEGEFKKGCASGLGVMRLANGGWFEGKFKRNMKHGFGKERTGQGDYYEGDFWKGQRHGRGHLIRSTGEVFEGEFTHGHAGTSRSVQQSARSEEPNKKGVVSYKMHSGDLYDGEMKNGKPHGHGALRKVDGSWYQGQFLNGKMHGEGQFHFADGREYSGMWKNGLQHGSGTMKPSGDGVSVKGIWVNGKKKHLG